MFDIRSETDNSVCETVQDVNVKDSKEPDVDVTDTAAATGPASNTIPEFYNDQSAPASARDKVDKEATPQQPPIPPGSGRSAVPALGISESGKPCHTLEY